MSTVQWRGLTAEEVSAGNSTVRWLGLSVDEGAALAVDITGPTGAEVFDAITLTAVATSGVASGFVWAQTAGPTVLTPVAAGNTYRFEVPGGRIDVPVDLTFRVTAQPGDVVATHTITVTPPLLLMSSGGEWVPVPQYLIT